MRSEVLTMICIRILVFWDMMPCSLVNDCKYLREFVATIFRAEEEWKHKVALKHW